MKTSTRAVMLLVTLAAAGTCASGAASFTSINNTSGEVSQAGLLNAIYGGTWTRLPGTQSYTNGSLTAFRVADDGRESPLDILGGNPLFVEDDIWSGGEATVTAKAKYAADNHTFGWINGSSGTSGFQPIFTTTSLNVPTKLMLTSSFRWALRDETTNQTFTSKESNNPGDTDMMATYAISGAGIHAPTWLLVWEDRTTNSDRDFNDAAIEVSAVTTVPEPATFVLAGMGMLAMRRRRR